MKKKRTWPWTRPDPKGAERIQLEEELDRTKVLLAQAYAGFNAVTDGDLVEFYIYEIQALRARYSYLIQRRKALEEPAPAAAPPLRDLPESSAAAGEIPAKVLPLRPALPVA